MGNVERCDTTLPLNEMIFPVRRDPTLRTRWRTGTGMAVWPGLATA